MEKPWSHHRSEKEPEFHVPSFLRGLANSAIPRFGISFFSCCCTAVATLSGSGGAPRAPPAKQKPPKPLSSLWCSGHARPLRRANRSESHPLSGVLYGTPQQRVIRNEMRVAKTLQTQHQVGGMKLDDDWASSIQSRRFTHHDVVGSELCHKEPSY